MGITGKAPTNSIHSSMCETSGSAVSSSLQAGFLRSIPLVLFVIVALCCLLVPARNAWALQSHGAPEGIYVHQMAHLLFSASLGYLYWHTRRSPALVSRGWKYLQIFCILLISWNLLALTGHEIFDHLRPEDFIAKHSWREALAPPMTLGKTVYYISKMDHCLNVPALMALVISLRAFYHDAVEQSKQAPVQSVEQRR